MAGCCAGVLSEISVCGIDYGCEAPDVDRYGVSVVAGVCLGIVPPATGGVEQCVHAAEKFDEFVKAVGCIGGGDVKADVPHMAGVHISDGFHRGLAAGGHAYEPTHAGEVGGDAQSQAR